jgi:hypothetical protein
MELSSVRDLKAALTEAVVLPVASRAASLSYSVAAQPLRNAAQPSSFHRSLALGIARSGKSDFKLAVRIQQRLLENSSEVDRIRRRARGEVDVRYIGKVGKCAVPWYRQRQRPLRIGCSVGHFSITAGTLGCFVAHLAGSDRAVLFLSNNHVLANENKAKNGDAIVQPGTADHGAKPADVIGSLERFVRLQKNATNLMDAAVALLANGLDPSPMITGVGKISGLDEDLSEGRSVFKVGRTTGLTEGKVSAFEFDHIVAGYDMGNLKFDNLIEIEGVKDQPFAQGGDSGSLVVNEKAQALGLVFATSDIGGTNGKGLTYANPLSPILDKMQLRLIY